MSDIDLNNLKAEDFRFAERGEHIRDKKPETKPVGYFRDAWRRFKKNKASIVAVCIIALLLLFSLFAPVFSSYDMSFSDPVYRNKIPKNEVLAHIGIATGVYNKDLNTRAYDYYAGIGIGATYDRETDTEDNSAAVGSEYAAIRKIVSEETGAEMRTKVSMDAYLEVGFYYLSITEAEYADILAYEEETGEQVLDNASEEIT